MKNKGGQVTIFIIIAIVIIAGFVVFLTFRGGLSTEKIPKDIEPVYNTFLSCLEQDVLTGVSVLGSQAGYIEVPDLEAGSFYMPFSSQLDFLGNPVPYWYYVSGNNFEREQVPSRNEMESQLENFIEERVRDCNFDSYYEQGFEIFLQEPKADIEIRGKEVEVNLDMVANINYNGDSAEVKTHSLVVKSELGNLYDSAIEVYEREQEDLFLEEYALDFLSLYAPLDGFEISCSPKTWNAQEIFNELEDAIEVNTLALKTEGSEKDYFKLDFEVNNDVRFVQSKNWPKSFEVAPSEGPILIAEPIGNQQGFGILGFCYVPYHFVYNVKYPVLVQVYSGDETFQFPLAVILQGNNPREPLEGSALNLESEKLCDYKNTLMNIQTYDVNLNPIEAEISYVCLGSKCDIGETNLDGVLQAEFPQCVNGKFLASAEGYETMSFINSTVSSSTISLVLDRLYEKEINLKLDNLDYNGNALINFISDSSSKAIFYPESKTVELIEGEYEIQVQIFKDVSLEVGATTTEQCVEVPRQGLGGVFGLKEEKCFEIDFPSQLVSSALVGGGIQKEHFLESELINSEVLELSAKSLPSPNSIEQLQDNYLLFEVKDLGVYLR